MGYGDELPGRLGRQQHVADDLRFGYAARFMPLVGLVTGGGSSFARQFPVEARKLKIVIPAKAGIQLSVDL